MRRLRFKGKIILPDVADDTAWLVDEGEIVGLVPNPIASQYESDCKNNLLTDTFLIGIKNSVDIFHESISQ